MRIDLEVLKRKDLDLMDTKGETGRERIRENSWS